MQKTKTPLEARVGHDRVTDEASSWASASQQIVEFTYEQDFIELCGNRGASPEDQTSYEYAMALSEYVSQYTDVHTEDGTLTDDEATRLRLIGQYPASSYRARIATEWKGEILNPEDLRFYRGCKLELVKYNQELSDYMYRKGSDLKLRDIAGAINNGVLQMSPEPMNISQRQMMVFLRGARTEAINHSLVDRLRAMLPDMVKGRRATPEEDQLGVDFVVNFDGKNLYLDFKSSVEAIVLGGKTATSEGVMAGYSLKPSRSPDGRRLTVALLSPPFDEASLGDACSLSDIQAGPVAMALGNTLASVAKQV